MSYQLPKELEQRLVRLAEIRNCSIEELLTLQTEQLERYERERQEDEDIFQEMKAGNYINNDDMMKFLDDLDAGNIE